MIEFPLIFLAGLVGSSHCLGMCGPFALALGGTVQEKGATGWFVGLRRQTVYTAGRIFTYMTLGAMAGFGGLHLARSAPWMVNIPAVLAILAGLLLVYQGLLSAGIIPRRVKTTGGGPCLAGTFFASFLNSPKASSVFLAGLFTGLLPCGLLYGMLALAASSASMLTAAIAMGLFGLGTAPAMILAGCGGSLISMAARRRLWRVAAWCVVVTGVFAIARGFGFVHIPGWTVAAGCPMCH